VRPLATNRALKHWQARNWHTRADQIHSRGRQCTDLVAEPACCAKARHGGPSWSLSRPRHPAGRPSLWFCRARLLHAARVFADLYCLPLTIMGGAAAFLPLQPAAFSWPSLSTSWAHALAPLRVSLAPPWPPATEGAGGPPLSDVRWILAAWAVYLPALAVTYVVVGALSPPPPRPPPAVESSPRARARAGNAGTRTDARGKALTTADAVAAGHNFALAAASAVLLAGVVTAGARLVAAGRGADLFCTPPARAGGVGDGRLATLRYWLYLFYLSKFWELGDTFVLLARRKPLTLLHVWHHMSVMGETWAWLQFGMTLGAVGMAVNAGVHVLMYSYFGASVRCGSCAFGRVCVVCAIVFFWVLFLSTFSLLLILTLFLLCVSNLCMRIVGSHLRSAHCLPPLMGSSLSSPSPAPPRFSAAASPSAASSPAPKSPSSSRPSSSPPPWSSPTSGRGRARACPHWPCRHFATPRIWRSSSASTVRPTEGSGRQRRASGTEGGATARLSFGDAAMGMACVDDPGLWVSSAPAETGRLQALQSSGVSSG